VSQACEEGSSLTTNKGNFLCHECGGEHLIHDDEIGEYVCQSCGMVVSSVMVSTRPEWHAFDQEQRENLPRVGAPLTLTMHDRGLSTNIGYKNTDHTGKRLDTSQRNQFYRLRKWHQRSKIADSMNRNLSLALREITDMGTQLSLPRNVVETSCMIYRRALRNNLIRGRTIKSMVAACVYLACRQCGLVRTLDDVANVAGLTKKEAARNYRILVRKTEISVPQTNPRQYIGKIVNILRLNGDTEQLSLVILGQASELKLTNGRGPSGMAAACIYISTKITGDRSTQGDIAGAAQVTEVTIRNRYKELVENIDLIIEL
jgi:transcription initiation factor TFIIB